MLVESRTVGDTTGDSRWSPMTVRVRLAEPWVGRTDQRVHLDGPLAWCAFVRWQQQSGRILPPLRQHEQPQDFDLGLATWTAPNPGGAPPWALTGDGEVWGWACSGHRLAALAHTSVATRKRPAVMEMVRHTTDRRHHLSAGSLKARDVHHPATWVDTLEWDALGDPRRVASLLSELTHMGRLKGHGFGRVLDVEVSPGGDPGGWRRRSWPDPDGARTEGIRAPYWHQSRQVRCR